MASTLALWMWPHAPSRRVPRSHVPGLGRRLRCSSAVVSCRLIVASVRWPFCERAPRPRASQRVMSRISSIALWARISQARFRVAGSFVAGASE
jgi:hypothetical protein